MQLRDEKLQTGPNIAKLKKYYPIPFEESKQEKKL